MRSDLPTLRQLSHLVALHEHGHFGRAAAASFVSQSALSVGVAELERQLGVALVDRSRRAIRFTPAGQATVARARAVLRDAGDLVTAARAAAEPLMGPLRLAVIPTVAPFLLPRLLPALAEAWPRLELFVHESLTTPACQALHADQTDCVLLALPVDCGDVDSRELAVDRLLLAEPSSKSATEPVRAGELDVSRMLFLEDGHCLTEHALAACRSARQSDKARLVASTLQTLVRLVEAGQGSTLVPLMAVDAGLLAGLDVIARPIAEAVAERRIALVWRRGHPRTAEFALLAKAIVKAITD